MITITQKGDFGSVEAYLDQMKSQQAYTTLSKYGSLGVAALSNATPVDTGETAQSWYYEIVQRPGYYSIRWHNGHVEDGIPIAIILEYGHGTRNGGWVEGRNYVMPAILPIFDQIVAEADQALRGR